MSEQKLDGQPQTAQQLWEKEHTQRNAASHAAMSAYFAVTVAPRPPIRQIWDLPKVPVAELTLIETAPVVQPEITAAA